MSETNPSKGNNAEVENSSWTTMTNTPVQPRKSNSDGLKGKINIPKRTQRTLDIHQGDLVDLHIRANGITFDSSSDDNDITGPFNVHQSGCVQIKKEVRDYLELSAGDIMEIWIKPRNQTTDHPSVFDYGDDGDVSADGTAKADPGVKFDTGPIPQTPNGTILDQFLIQNSSNRFVFCQRCTLKNRTDRPERDGEVRRIHRIPKDVRDTVHGVDSGNQVTVQFVFVGAGGISKAFAVDRTVTKSKSVQIPREVEQQYDLQPGEEYGWWVTPNPENRDLGISIEPEDETVDPTEGAGVITQVNQDDQQDSDHQTPDHQDSDQPQQDPGQNPDQAPEPTSELEQEPQDSQEPQEHDQDATVVKSSGLSVPSGMIDDAETDAADIRSEAGAVYHYVAGGNGDQHIMVSAIGEDGVTTDGGAIKTVCGQSLEDSDQAALTGAESDTGSWDSCCPVCEEFGPMDRSAGRYRRALRVKAGIADGDMDDVTEERPFVPGELREMLRSLEAQDQ